MENEEHNQARGDTAPRSNQEDYYYYYYEDELFWKILLCRQKVVYWINYIQSFTGAPSYQLIIGIICSILLLIFGLKAI